MLKKWKIWVEIYNVDKLLIQFILKLEQISLFSSQVDKIQMKIDCIFFLNNNVTFYFLIRKIPIKI